MILIIMKHYASGVSPTACLIFLQLSLSTLRDSSSSFLLLLLRVCCCSATISSVRWRPVASEVSASVVKCPKHTVMWWKPGIPHTNSCRSVMTSTKPQTCLQAGSYKLLWASLWAIFLLIISDYYNTFLKLYWNYN